MGDVFNQQPLGVCTDAPNTVINKYENDFGINRLPIEFALHLTDNIADFEVKNK